MTHLAHPLDDPVWSALRGPHAGFCVGGTRALAYQRGVTLFSAIAEPSQAAYDELQAWLPTDLEARLFRPCLEPLPAGWEHVIDYPLLQMVASAAAPAALPAPAPGPAQAEGADASRPVRLTPADLPDMLALVEQTQPGPFGVRALELGNFYGIRCNGQLVAMAGERLRVAGHVELSGICTLAQARGRGLAGLLMRTLMEQARLRGEHAFLHVVASNAAAIAMYERMGFAVRRQLQIVRRKPVGERGPAIPKDGH